MTECTYSVSKRDPGKRLAIDDLVVMPCGSVDIIEDVRDITDQEGFGYLVLQDKWQLVPFLRC
jgi:hypothetical protein